MRSAVVLVGVIGLFACDGACPDKQNDDPSPSSFSGIEGVISMVGGGCNEEEGCPAPTPAVGTVRAMQGGDLVAEVSLDPEGKFGLQLDPGTFDVEIAALETSVDRSLESLEVAIDSGHHLTRNYRPEVEPLTLEIEFADDVSTVRISEILEASGFQLRLGLEHYVVVEVATGSHPQLEGEEAMRTFPDEVVAFDLSPYQCFL